MKKYWTNSLATELSEDKMRVGMEVYLASEVDAAMEEKEEKILSLGKEREVLEEQLVNHEAEIKRYRESLNKIIDYGDMTWKEGR